MRRKVKCGRREIKIENLKVANQDLKWKKVKFERMESNLKGWEINGRKKIILKNAKKNRQNKNKIQ